MRLVVLGPPGSGKGTQAARLADHLEVPHISTGDLLRDHVSRHKTLGKKAKSSMDKGLLVKDDLAIEITKERLAEKDCKKGWILDGFPRSMYQAEKLEKFAKPDMVLNLFIETGELVKRLSGRRICTKCQAVYNVYSNPPKKEDVCDECKGELIQRDDDMEEVVENRIEVYEELTRPLVKHYTQKDILVSVYGIGTIEQVFNRVLEALERKA